MNTRTENVSFRADQDLLRLIDIARKPFGVSRGVWARGAVQTALYRLNTDAAPPDVSADISALHLELQNVAAEVQRLRVEQARLLLSILTNVGKFDEQSAREMVRAAIKS